jgi:hypothetical protein
MTLLKRSWKFLFFAAVLLASPPDALSCACGCSVYFVGTRWMMVTSSGTRLFFQYSYLDQSQNWSGLRRASADLNPDKLITTSFYAVGLQYMLDRDWGLMVTMPVWDRYRRGIDDEGTAFSVRHRSIGDAKIMGMYTGFSDDMSTALTFGLKLPTGRFNESFFDRDIQIGTGTTDLMLSAYQMAQYDRWGWFVQGAVEAPLNGREGYKPGSEFNAAFGVHYDGLNSSLGLVPLASIVASFRGRDSGPQAEPENTGYTRLFASAGVEVILNGSIHVDVEAGLPLYSQVNGIQLVAPQLLNSTVSVQF